MSEQWYLRTRGKVSGPFDLSQIESLIRRQILGKHDEVSSDKVDWRRASEISEFFATKVTKKVRNQPETHSRSVPQAIVPKKPYPPTNNVPSSRLPPAVADVVSPQAEHAGASDRQTEKSSPASLVWLAIGSVAAGLALFTGIAIVLASKLQYLGPVNPNSVIAESGQTAQITSVDSPLENDNPEVNSSRSEGQNVNSAAVNNSDQNVKAGNETSTAKPTARTPSPTGSSQASAPQSKPTLGNPNNQTAAPTARGNSPQTALPGPFAGLPSDGFDGRLGLLNLFADTNGAWTVVLNDPTELQMELLGSEVFHPASIATYELQSSQAGAARIWTLCLQSKDDVIEFGEFRYLSNLSNKNLSFTWRDRAKSRPEADAIRFLAVGLSAGKDSRLCRLHETSSKPLLSYQFKDPKDYKTELSLDLDPLLAEKLKADDCALLINMDLVGDIVDLMADNKKVLHGIHPKEQRKVQLTASSKQKLDPEWSAYENDPNLALLEVGLQLSARSFSVQLAAFANVALLKEGQFSKSAIQFPVPENSKIPLSTESLQRRFSPAIAKRLTAAIERWSNSAERRDQFQNSNRSKLNMPPGQTPLNPATNSNPSSPSTDDVAQNLARHKPESMKWLGSVLAGGPNQSDAGNSIRGAIINSKLKVQIVYPCEFAGTKHTIVVFTASQ